MDKQRNRLQDSIRGSDTTLLYHAILFLQRQST
jgi:hypothetical protein